MIARLLFFIFLSLVIILIYILLKRNNKTVEQTNPLSLTKQEDLQLEFYLPPHHNPIIFSKQARLADIHKAIKQQSWQDITFIVLKKDEANYIEVSGCYDDGFSAKYVTEGEEFISEEPPESLEAMIKLLQSYLLNDNHWKTMLKWV